MISDPNKMLHDACSLKEKDAGLKLVLDAMEKGADINSSREGCTPLMGAAYFGHTEIAKELLKRKADVSPKNKNKNSALLFATKKGHNDIAKLLLTDGANVDDKDDIGSTPIFYAIINNNKELVKAFLKFNANLNIQNKDKLSPLQVAASTGQTEVVKLMLQHKADIKKQNKLGYTALFSASFQGHADIVKLLLNEPEVNLFEQCGKEGHSILSRAAWFLFENPTMDETEANASILNLLQAGSYVDLKINEGKYKGFTTSKMIKYLWFCIDHSIHKILSTSERLLEIAHQKPDKKLIDEARGIIDQLKQIKSTQAINARSVLDGNTALHRAFLNKNTELSELLLLAGASVTIRNKGKSKFSAFNSGAAYNMGVSVYDLAVTGQVNCEPHIKEMIINQRLEELITRQKPESQNYADYEKELCKNLRIFFNAGNINQFMFDKNSDSAKTPLMLALACQNYVAAKWLLENDKIEVDLKNKIGENAFTYFARFGGDKIKKEALEGDILPPPTINEDHDISLRRIQRRIKQLLDEIAEFLAIKDAIENDASGRGRTRLDAVKEFISKELSESRKRIIIKYINEQIEKLEKENTGNSNDNEILQWKTLLENPQLKIDSILRFSSDTVVSVVPPASLKDSRYHSKVRI